MHYILILFLLSPFLILFSHSPQFNITDSSELLFVFNFTFRQAFVSSLVSVLLGFIGALGLLNLSSYKNIKLIEFTLLFPCFVPVIFIVFSCLNLSTQLGYSLRGFWGIVFVHVIINVGLCSVLLAKNLRNRLIMINKLYTAQSGNVLSYFKSFLVPIVYKEVLFLFAAVFLFCFTSFSIPLVIGGVSSTTVDLLIYENLINGKLAQAASIALLQFIFIAILLYVLNYKRQESENINKGWVNCFKFDLLIGVAIVPTVILVLGLCIGLEMSAFYKIIQPETIDLIVYSLSIAFFSGYTIFLFIQLILIFMPNKTLFNFLSYYSSPSTALVSLAVVLLVSEQNLLKLLLFLVYVLIFIPYFFKMFLQNFMSKNLKLVQLSLIMGANWWQRYKLIIFPMSLRLSLFLSFLTAGWVMGDYAVTSVLLKGDVTLALKIKSYMRSYQLQDAYGLLLVILLCEFLLFLVYKGLVRYAYKKY